MNPESIYRETLVKQRRLGDVHRGKDYMKKFDQLALRHWNASPSSPRNDSSPRGITKGFSVPTKKHKKGPNNVLVSQLFKLPNPDEDKNKCKVSDWDLYVPESLRHSLERAKKIESTDDLKGSFIKGRELGRNGGVMSRVRKNDRPLWQTNVKSSFLTHNGSIRVISPPMGHGSAHSRSGDSISKQFLGDQETIERERTLQMLRRIDLILHPHRVHALNTIGESVEENMSNDTPSLPDSNEVFRPATKPVFVMRNTYKPVLCDNTNYSLIDYLRKQKHKSVDTFKKCELWINNWVQ